VRVLRIRKLLRDHAACRQQVLIDHVHKPRYCPVKCCKPYRDLQRPAERHVALTVETGLQLVGSDSVVFRWPVIELAIVLYAVNPISVAHHNGCLMSSRTEPSAISPIEFSAHAPK